MSRLAPCLLLGFTFGLSACSKSEPPAPAEAVPTAAPAPAPPPSPEPVKPPAAVTPTPSEPGGSGDIATEEDFEDESAKAITAENLDAQLDALEKEILAE